MSFRPSDPGARYARLIVLTERLHDAIAARDETLVRAILDAPSASSLPRGVREEALAILALPPTSYRVPMQLLQFHHRITELARTEDDAELRAARAPWNEEVFERADESPAADPAQIDLPFRRYAGEAGSRDDSRW